MKALAAALAAALACLALALPAAAAAPNYILVSGTGLAHPRLLGNWSENLRLLLAVADAPRARGAAVAGLSRRPRLDLAEFWAWSGRPRPTSAKGASQHATLYPAHGSEPAVIRMTVQGVTVPRLLSARVRAIFGRHGIPLRL